MEESRLRQNPRNPAFLSDPSSQKPPPLILERFRSLLKQIQDQVRPTASSKGDDEPRPTMEDIVRLYEDVLSELTYNSKPIITDLTIIAGDHKDCGEGIADAICRRIVEVPAEQKLPSLYLLDSIVKNIGQNYVRYFAARLFEVFCEAYKQVHPSQYTSMRHLFRTWSAVFPTSILRKIESELQFSSPASHQTSSWTASRPSDESPSPRPAHGIHVNPKYLEARRQLEHSAVMHEPDPNNNAHMADFGGELMERNTSSSPKGWFRASPKFHGVSSRLQPYGRKSTIEYAEEDFDQAEVPFPSHTAARIGSTVAESDRLLAPPKSKGLRASLAPTIRQTRPLSPSTNGFMRDISPRIDERASPSHSGFVYGLGRVNDWGGKRNELREGNWSDDGSQQIETSSLYPFSNGYEQQHPRALIDAYGNYRGKDPLQEKLSKVEGLEVNGNSKSTDRKWQNVEEEEYDWEDMSPTLADRSKGNDLVPSESQVGGSSMSAGFKRPNGALFEPEIRSNGLSQAQLSQLGHGPLRAKSLNNTVTQNGSLPHLDGPYQTQEPSNLSHRFLQSSNPYLFSQSRRTALQMPFSAIGIVPSAGQKISPLDSTLEAEAPLCSYSSIESRIGYSNPETSNMGVLSSAGPASTMEKHLAQRPHSPPVTPMIRPPLQNSRPLSLVHSNLPSHPQFDLLDVNRAAVSHGSHKHFNFSRPQFDAADRTSLNSSKLLQFPQMHAGLISSIQPPNLERDALIPAPASHLVAQPLNHGLMQGQGAIRSAIFPNPFPGISSSSVAIHSMPGTSFHVPRGALPPLPPGPPPVSSQMGPTPQTTGPIISHRPSGSGFSGLIGSLMAQGLIALTTPATPQDSIGLEFDLELLKVRHESAINALYTDLPRQCTTCGQRFKSQEEHSNHMDWHVTKNRMSKNRKQNPSRKWFVSAKEWFSGAEALGTDSVPGFLANEAVVEKREDEELAVPADENQNMCALCGEPFDDFYSDETEEWMYKGAVYLNAQDGSTEVMDRLQMGPIVHAKCRSESTVVPTEDFKQVEEGIDEESIQRKRMRI